MVGEIKTLEKRVRELIERGKRNERQKRKKKRRYYGEKLEK